MGFVAIKGDTPAGIFGPYAGYGAVPEGWLVCDGSAVSRTVYARLFAKIGVAWGYGDGSTTFNLPDSRGQVLRFQDGAAGVDPDAASRFAAVAGTFVLLNCAVTATLDVVGVSSTVGLSPGLTVSGTGIPASTVIREIVSGTQIRLGNLANTAYVMATLTGTVSLTFSRSAVGNYVGSFQDDQFGSHNHGGGNHAHNVPGVWLTSGGAGTMPAGGASVPGIATTLASYTIISTQGGNENRTKNFYATSLIKF
jgi:hypothetical protein